MAKLLEINDLQVRFFTPEGIVRAVEGVTLHLDEGETLAVVGESGCGKTVTARSIMRLIPHPPGKVTRGTINFKDRDVLAMSPGELRQFRGGDVAMIFQEPMTSLNPVFTIGRPTDRNHYAASESQQEGGVGRAPKRCSA